MPVIFSEISTDLRTLSSEEMTFRKGREKKAYFDYQIIMPNNYIEQLFIKHKAPEEILQIWWRNEKFCTIL